MELGLGGHEVHGARESPGLLPGGRRHKVEPLRALAAAARRSHIFQHHKPGRHVEGQPRKVDVVQRRASLVEPRCAVVDPQVELEPRATREDARVGVDAKQVRQRSELGACGLKLHDSVGLHLTLDGAVPRGRDRGRGEGLESKQRAASIATGQADGRRLSQQLGEVRAGCRRSLGQQARGGRSGGKLTGPRDLSFAGVAKHQVEADAVAGPRTGGRLHLGDDLDHIGAGAGIREAGHGLELCSKQVAVGIP